MWNIELQVDSGEIGSDLEVSAKEQEPQCEAVAVNVGLFNRPTLDARVRPVLGRNLRKWRLVPTLPSSVTIQKVRARVALDRPEHVLEGDVAMDDAMTVEQLEQICKGGNHLSSFPRTGQLKAELFRSITEG